MQMSFFKRIVAALTLTLSALIPTAQAEEVESLPAVSDFNTKFSVEGGILSGQGNGVLQGSVTMPLNHEWGIQLDGVVGVQNEEILAGGALHLFTRDPSRYLLGVYGSLHTWDSIDIMRLAVEAEFYHERLTLSGIAGWEDINVPSTKGGLTVTTPDDSHFFTDIDLSFYPNDNIRLWSGFHYENEESFGSAGIEFQPQKFEVPATMFVTGTYGGSEFTGVSGGIRFYFGANPNKSLIRRHREDDPQTYLPVFPQLLTKAKAEDVEPKLQCTPSGGSAQSAIPGTDPQSLAEWNSTQPCTCNSPLTFMVGTGTGGQFNLSTCLNDDED